MSKWYLVSLVLQRINSISEAADCDYKKDA